MLNCRLVESVNDCNSACVCCGSSMSGPIQIFVQSKEILLDYEFVNYAREFIEYKFLTCPNSDVVLKWGVPEGVVLFCTIEKDFSNTCRILHFLQGKFTKAQNAAKTN